jgi:hypothetical protein
MKKKSTKLFFWGWVIIASILITLWWFNSIHAISLSEYLWSEYNQIFGGQKPGLASDLEFLTVITIAAIIIGFLTRLTFWTIKKTRKNKR